MVLAHVPALSLQSGAETPFLWVTLVSDSYHFLLNSFLLPDVENSFLVGRQGRPSFTALTHCCDPLFFFFYSKELALKHKVRKVSIVSRFVLLHIFLEPMNPNDLAALNERRRC